MSQLPPRLQVEFAYNLLNPRCIVVRGALFHFMLQFLQSKGVRGGRGRGGGGDVWVFGWVCRLGRRAGGRRPLSAAAIMVGRLTLSRCCARLEGR